MEPFIPIVMFISFAWMVKALSDNKTKRMIIEKAGLNENIKYLYYEPNKQANSSLKWGIVLVALGVALVIYKLFFFYESEEVAFGIMFLFAGAGLILYYFLARSRTEDILSQQQPKPDNSNTVEIE